MDTNKNMSHQMFSHPACHNEHKTEKETKDKKIKEVARRQIAEFEECHFLFTMK